MNNIETELYGTSGSLYALSTLLDAFSFYYTNAYHSAHTFEHAYGFTGANVWHYFDIYSTTDMSTYMAITLKNMSQKDSQSGTFYWEIREDDDTVLGSGLDSTGTVVSNGTVVINCYYSGGTPYKIAYRYSTALSFTEFIF